MSKTSKFFESRQEKPLLSISERIAGLSNSCLFGFWSFFEEHFNDIFEKTFPQLNYDLAIQLVYLEASDVLTSWWPSIWAIFCQRPYTLLGNTIHSFILTRDFRNALKEMLEFTDLFKNHKEPLHFLKLEKEYTKRSSAVLDSMKKLIDYLIFLSNKDDKEPKQHSCEISKIKRCDDGKIELLDEKEIKAYKIYSVGALFNEEQIKVLLENKVLFEKKGDLEGGLVHDENLRLRHLCEDYARESNKIKKKMELLSERTQLMLHEIQGPLIKQNAQLELDSIIKDCENLAKDLQITELEDQREEFQKSTSELQDRLSESSRKLHTTQLENQKLKSELRSVGLRK